MKKTKIKIIARQALYALVGVATMLAYFPMTASAAQLTTRSVKIGNSAALTTTYNFTFTTVSGTTVKGVTLVPCTTASGACTMPPGFSATGSTLSSSSGLSTGGTWVVDAGTSSQLAANNTGSTSSTPGVATLNFSNVTNPTGTAAVFYMRITTWGTITYTGSIDMGTVATATTSNVTVSANVDESLTFTVTNTAVVMTPTLGSAATGTGVSDLAVATNGTGYSISYSGTTLTSGSNSIANMGTKATSTQGSAQFGMNLMVNTTPAVGVAKTGSGTIASNYSTANSFTFIPAGEAMATGTNTSDAYTVSYIANIPATQAPGAYTATVNYVATSTF
jgi:hypothetical protein